MDKENMNILSNQWVLRPWIEDSFWGSLGKTDDLELDSWYFNQNSLYWESSKDYNVHNILDDYFDQTPLTKSPWFALEESLPWCL